MNEGYWALEHEPVGMTGIFDSGMRLSFMSRVHVDQSSVSQARIYRYQVCKYPDDSNIRFG
jgi:hypothetical protein